MTSWGTSNIQLIVFINDKYIKPVIVCLKHIQYSSAITEIGPVSFMYD